MCSPDLSRVHKEHKVPPGLRIELEELEDRVPLVHGMEVRPELDQGPIVCQGLVDDLQVVVLEVLEMLIPQELQPTQGPQCDIRSLEHRIRFWFRI